MGLRVILKLKTGELLEYKADFTQIENKEIKIFTFYGTAILLLNIIETIKIVASDCGRE